MDKNNRDILNTSAILAGSGVGILAGYKGRNILPGNTIVKTIVAPMGGAVAGGVLGSALVADNKQNFTDTVTKSLGTQAGQVSIPIPVVGGVLGYNAADKISTENLNKMKNKIDSKYAKIDLNDLLLGGATAGAGVFGYSKYRKTKHGTREFSADTVDDLKWVMAHPSKTKKFFHNKILMNAEVVDADNLTEGKKINGSVIAVAGGDTLFDKALWKKDLNKHLESGRVINNFTDLDLTEDKWNFYKAHKDSGKMPLTILASDIKDMSELQETFKDKSFIGKLRTSFGGHGSVEPGVSYIPGQKIIKNGIEVMHDHDIPINGFEDIIGNDEYVFQERVKMKPNYAGEYRVTAANGRVLDVLRRDNGGDLVYSASKNIEDAQKLDDVRNWTQEFVGKDLKVNPKGVHALDVFEDIDGKYWINESNAANGANIRTRRGSKQIVNALEKALEPISEVEKLKSMKAAKIGIAGAGALLAGLVAKKFMEKEAADNSFYSSKEIEDSFATPSSKAKSLNIKLLLNSAIPTLAGLTAYKTSDEDHKTSNTLMATGAGTIGSAYMGSHLLNDDNIKLNPNSKKVAIVTGNPKIGAGHYMQAKALKSAMEERGYQVDLIDNKAYMNKFFKRGFTGNNAPLYKAINNYTDTRPTDEFMTKSYHWDVPSAASKTSKGVWNKVYGVLTGLGLNTDVAQRDYKMVISNIPGGEKTLQGTGARSIAVPSDFGIINNLWHDSNNMGYVLSTEEAKADFLSKFPGEKVIVSKGLPVDKAHVDAANHGADLYESQFKHLSGKGKLEVNDKLEFLKSPKKRIIISGGGAGVSVVHGTEAFSNMLKKNNLQDQYQIISVAGSGNEDAFNYLKTKYANEAHIIPMSEAHTPSLFSNADVIVSRPGGTTTGELLVHGKPTISLFSNKTVLGEVASKGVKSHEMKNSDILEKYLSAPIAYADDSDSIERAFKEVTTNRKISDKAAKFGAEYRTGNIPGSIVDAIEEIYKDFKPLESDSKIKFLPKSDLGKIGLGLGGVLLASGAAKRYFEGKKNK